MPRPALLSWLRRRHRHAVALVARHTLLQRVPPGRRILEALDLVPDRPRSSAAPAAPRFYPGFILEPSPAAESAPPLASIADYLEMAIENQLEAVTSLDEPRDRPLMRAVGGEPAARLEATAPSTPSTVAPPPRDAPTPASSAAWMPVASAAPEAAAELVMPETDAAPPSPVAARDTDSTPPTLEALLAVATALPPVVEPELTTAALAARLDDDASLPPEVSLEMPAMPREPSLPPTLPSAQPAPPAPVLRKSDEARLVAAVREVLAREQSLPVSPRATTPELPPAAAATPAAAPAIEAEPELVASAEPAPLAAAGK